MDKGDVALFRRLPEVGRAVPWVRLGAWPTPIEAMPALGRGLGGGDIFVKREDRSSPVYGGNKVRTLEAVLGRAQAAGARIIWATGAYGSNHAVATVMHAPAAAMDAGVLMFPQPPSDAARANLAAMIARGAAIERIASVALLPFAMHRLRGDGVYVMPPGGATPEGAMGALSAAIELAEQIEARACPLPARIVLAVGSTCTTAGLLAGLHLAAALGIGFTRDRLPRVTAVRVTPWPVTDPWRVAMLAHKTLALVDAARGDRTGVGVRGLRAALTVEGRYFGGGYGRATARGLRAAARFREAGGPPLDAVYSAKAGAALCDLAPHADGPTLFWATKSSAPLPSMQPGQREAIDPVLRAWLATAHPAR